MGAAERRLVYKVFVEDKDGEITSFGPDDDVPGWAAKQITNPSAWGEESTETRFGPGGEAPKPDAEPDGDEGGEDDGPEGSDYSKLKKPELEAEVAKRNEAREADDQIQVGGNGTVKDLRAALEADDTAGD